MAEGIIQQVFSRYIDRTAPKTPPFDILSRIERELIEKIKKEFPTYGTSDIDNCDCAICNTVRYNIEKLIGDNNE